MHGFHADGKAGFRVNFQKPVNSTKSGLLKAAAELPGPILAMQVKRKTKFQPELVSQASCAAIPQPQQEQNRHESKPSSRRLESFFRNFSTKEGLPVANDDSDASPS
jgi:hypothetical protein